MANTHDKIAISFGAVGICLSTQPHFWEYSDSGASLLLGTQTQALPSSHSSSFLRCWSH
jgi:hypothetical protein